MYIHVYTVKIKKLKKNTSKTFKKAIFCEDCYKNWFSNYKAQHLLTIQWIIFYCRIFNTYETKYRFLQTLLYVKVWQKKKKEY